MASSLGSLVVSLGLDAAEFTAGLTKSEYQARKFAQGLEKNIAAGIIKAEIAMRAFGTAAKTAANVFQSLTLDAAQYKDLEETTGASAESLASLAVAGATAGVTMESIGGAANKLTKNLVGVDDESKAAGAALEALNIDIKAFKQLDPAAQYEQLAKAFASFSDEGTGGADKVAASMALFGKSGAEQLKVFKALEEQGGRTKILTQEQIEQADAFADAQAKSAAELRLYAQAAATQAIPALVDLTKAAVEVAKEFLGVDKASGQLAANSGVKSFAESAVDALAFVVDAGDGVVRVFNIVGKTIAAVAAQAALLKSGEFRAAGEVGKQLASDVDDILGRQTLRSRVADQRALRAATGEPAGAAGAKPRLNFNGPPDTSGAAAAAKEQKRILDGQLKDIRAFAEQQKDGFEFANRYVKGVYDAGLISLQDYYANETRIREAGLQASLQAIDREAAALQAAKPKATGADRVEIENKIADAIARRVQAEQRAAQDTVLAAQQQDAALLQLQRRYEDLTASMMESAGNSAGAAAIRISQQVEDARAVLRSAGKDSSVADRYGEQLTNLERLKTAQSEYGDLLDRARNAEESLLIDARAAGATELETLRAVGAARQQSLNDLGALVAKARELADVLGTPEAQRFAADLAAQFKRAAAEVDPLLQKVRDVGGEMAFAIAGGFEDAIVSGKGLREVLQGIEKDLIAIVTRQLVTQPLGNMLTNLIGGTGMPGGGGGIIGSLLGSILMGGAKTGGVGGYGLPGSFAGLFAGGGNIGAGQWGIVGDKGPEIVRGPANVVPNNRSMQMLRNASGSQQRAPAPVVMNINVAGSFDRRTVPQIGAEVARRMSDASRRNN